MTQDVKEWLPKDAFTDDAVKAILAAPLEQWSGAWFLHRTVAISRIRMGQGRTVNASASRQFQGALAVAELPETAKRQLLDAALEFSLAEQILSEDDGRVLDLFAAKIAEDLIARLDAAFSGEKANARGPRVSFAVSLSGADLFEISIPQHVLVPVLKSRLSAPRKSTQAPRSRMKAFGPTALTVNGLLGRAELAVEDLRGLAPGDVLVLDRALNETVELRLDGSNRNIGRGRLDRAGDRVSIQF